MNKNYNIHIAKLKKSDDHMNIDKYRVAANITEYHIISNLSKIHDDKANTSCKKSYAFYVLPKCIRNHHNTGF